MDILCIFVVAVEYAEDWRTTTNGRHPRQFAVNVRCVTKKTMRQIIIHWIEFLSKTENLILAPPARHNTGNTAQLGFRFPSPATVNKVRIFCILAPLGGSICGTR